MREMEFRFNLITWTSINFLWLGLTLVSIELIFGQIQSIAGWDKNEVLLLVYTVSLFNDFMWTFVYDSVNNFSELIRRGNLDFVLLKPASPRFIVSTRYPEFDHYLRMILLFFLIRQSANNLVHGITIFSWLNYWLLFLVGIFAFYNLVFALAVTNFWFIRLFNTQELIDTFVNIGKYPISIFKGGTKLFLMYLVPVAFVAYFPVMVLLGRITPKIILVGLVIDILTFAGSQWFWHFALRRYQSASS